MSGGLTSYPRTGGDGGSDLTRFLEALEAVRAGGSWAEQAARDLIDALRRMGSAGLSHEAGVAFALDARNTLFLALGRGTIITPSYHEAMLICAAHWKELHPIETTALAQMLREAMAAAANRQTAKELKDASERLGMIASFYEISAILGRDLIKDYGATRKPVAGHPRYVAASDASGQLCMLESAASYNINIFVRENIPGAKAPLIVTGEGKGGASRYGSARVPAAMRNQIPNPVVRQNSIDYAATRAEYMKRSEINAERREAGEEIRGAYDQMRLSFLAVRGVIENGWFKATLEFCS